MVSRGSPLAILSNAGDLVMIYSLVHLGHPFVIRLTELIITVNISVILATLMNSWTLTMRLWFTIVKLLLMGARTHPLCSSSVNLNLSPSRNQSRRLQMSFAVLLGGFGIALAGIRFG
jgi:hypothetical protein